MKTIAAVVLSDRGELLPYTCQATMQGCDEEAPKVLAAWDKMKELGARVVQVEITTLEEVVDPRLKDWVSTDLTRKVAYNKGWDSGYAKAGEGESNPYPHNPYPHGTDEDKEWLRGHSNGYQDSVDSWGVGG